MKDNYNIIEGNIPKINMEKKIFLLTWKWKKNLIDLELSKNILILYDYLIKALFGKLK